jgi:hypothetical protein
VTYRQGGPGATAPPGFRVDGDAARLLADLLRLVVDGVVTLDNSGNLAGLERQMAAIQAGPDPEDAAADERPRLDVTSLLTTRRIR